MKPSHFPFLLSKVLKWVYWSIMSFFEKVPLAPPDPIFGLTVAFQKDPRSNKVNLGAGIYKTEDLKTPVLSSVKAAEAALLDSEKSKEYLPIDGERHYLDLMGAMVFGKEKWERQKERIAAFQTIGGTGRGNRRHIDQTRGRAPFGFQRLHGRIIAECLRTAASKSKDIPTTMPRAIGSILNI